MRGEESDSERWSKPVRDPLEVLEKADEEGGRDATFEVLVKADEEGGRERRWTGAVLDEEGVAVKGLHVAQS